MALGSKRSFIPVLVQAPVKDYAVMALATRRLGMTVAVYLLRAGTGQVTVDMLAKLPTVDPSELPGRPEIWSPAAPGDQPIGPAPKKARRSRNKKVVDEA